MQGTRGIVRRFPEFQVCLERKARVEGDRPEYAWEPGSGYLAEYEHPLWKQALERAASGSGTGGKPAPVTAELLEDSRLIRALQAGVAPDFDVYDAATWSAVTPLSERSVADHSRPADFPDFTRGRWKTNPPVRILGV